MRTQKNLLSNKIIILILFLYGFVATIDVVTLLHNNNKITSLLIQAGVEKELLASIQSTLQWELFATFLSIFLFLLLFVSSYYYWKYRITIETGVLVKDLQLYQLAVDNASDHITITDNKGVILFVNKAAEIKTGFSKKELIGQRAGSKENYGGQMDKEFYRMLWNALIVEKKPFSGEVKNKRKNGDEYVVEAHIAPINNEETGEAEFFVEIERDISRQKEVDRMKTEFVSVASHQLRTPLSAVRWYGEMLLTGDAGKMNEEQHKFVEQMYDSSIRMIKLVNSLLNVSRIESGRIQIDPEPTDLGDLVDGVFEELYPRILAKDLRAVVTKHPKLGKVNVDPRLIREVYANILTNAVKYTPEGGEIGVSITIEKDAILTKISDNGLGIPRRQQEKIFTRFFRADNVVSTHQDGTGLGLYITKAIVESSGGKVWFESEENKGTTFWFTIPKDGMRKKTGDRTLAPTELSMSDSQKTAFGKAQSTLPLVKNNKK